MNHQENLNRVQAAKSGRWIVGESFRQASVVHIEDVLTRHVAFTRIRLPWPEPPWCNQCGERCPCPDYTSAITLLDALDGGRSDG